MDKQQEQLDTLKEIRSLMERSSRFLSLSGLSGVVIGIAALIGVVMAYTHPFLPERLEMGMPITSDADPASTLSFVNFLFSVASPVLLVAVGAAMLLTRWKARRQNLPVWDASARRMVINLAIPLVAGGVFCLVLLMRLQWELAVAATLVFYGLALVNASKYTLHDIRAVGLIEIVLGLVAVALPAYCIVLWALGFGVLHIIYGIFMYLKYEK